MNNLQRLYDESKEFRAMLTGHLVVFECWYRDVLGDVRIEDDVEADRWLMAPRGWDDGAAALERAKCDLEATKLYASRLRDQLAGVYGMAARFLDAVPAEAKTAGDLEEMNRAYDALIALGIEV